MEIPYTTDARPDTGLYNAKLGIWLFLASEIMLFGALFSSYVLLRVGAVEWPQGIDLQNVTLGTLNTMILITSSITVVMSWASLKMKDFSKFKIYMGSTLLLGFVFLTIKGFEYGAKFSHHTYPSESTYMAIYFTMTGLHGLHIIGGMLVFGYFLFRGESMWKSTPERFVNRIEVAGLYWHFVDLIWIFLFPVFYLL
jgi:cytochrome c oxidase subunit 3